MKDIRNIRNEEDLQIYLAEQDEKEAEQRIEAYKKEADRREDEAEVALEKVNRLIEKGVSPEKAFAAVGKEIEERDLERKAKLEEDRHERIQRALEEIGEED